MPFLASPPDVVRWWPWTGIHSDCSIAALSIACGVTYEIALSAALGAAPDCLTRGMFWSEVRTAAHLLGFKTALKISRYSLEDDTGILNVYSPVNKESTDHAVYLWEGRIIEPRTDRQQLWLDAEQYLNYYKYQAGGLLVITNDNQS